MIILNESVATLVSFPILGDPQEYTDPETNETWTYRPVIGYEPGITLLVDPNVVVSFPDLNEYLFSPVNPPQTPGEGQVWLRADTLQLFITAAPPEAIEWTLFFNTRD